VKSWREGKRVKETQREVNTRPLILLKERKKERKNKGKDERSKETKKNGDGPVQLISSLRQLVC